MTSASIVSGLADLAEAAYIDFQQVGPGGLEGSALKARFPTSDASKGWPETRVDEFIKNWRVVAHRPDMPSGFSGTVFERINPQPGESRYVFAARGTAGLVDIVEDLGNLVANGLAWEQVIDMYNWWQELTTPLGASYQRASAVRADDSQRFLPNVVAEPGQLWRIDRTATVQSQAPRLSASASVDVTGHSLGGHLATAFSRLFTSNTANVVTINGAGYSVLGIPTGNINRVFATLGGQATFPADRILNVYGDRGPEIVTQDFGLQQPGDHREARLEDFAFNNTLGHGSGQMSLSLALYDTLRRLTEGSAAGMDAPSMLSRFQSYLRSGSNDQYQDYEALVDNLRRLVLGDTERTVVGDAQSFHSRLIGLRNGAEFQSLAGHVNVLNASTIELSTLAQTDFSALASLLSLNPVVLQGKDPEGRSALEAIWQGASWNATHQQWLSDYALRQQGLLPETFTTQWLADRSALLGFVAERNRRDYTQGEALRTGQGGSNAYLYDYIDAQGTAQRLNVVDQGALGATGDAQRRRISFGSDAANAVDGGALGDHLYGGAGADTVRGLGGNDYLEGNAGADSLDGGAGNDTLLGGADADTYRFEGAFGSDVIIDATTGDTLTAVGLGDISTASLVRTGEHTWRNADSTVFFTRATIGPNRSDLSIDVAGTGPQARGTITVQHWQEGQLGLSLGGSVQQSGVHTLSGGNDFTDRGGSHGVPLTATVVLGQGGHDVVRGGASSDNTTALQLYGDEGNDIVFGNAGNDVIEGGEGNDLLGGGRGRDVIMAGAGNDFVSADFYNVRIRELYNGTQIVPEPDRPSDEDIWAQEGAGWGWRFAVSALGDRVQYMSAQHPSQTNFDAIGIGVLDGGVGDDFGPAMARIGLRYIKKSAASSNSFARSKSCRLL